jgi:hypothetical protein
MLIFFKWKEQAIIKLISLSLVTIFFQSQLDAFNNFNLDYIQSLFFSDYLRPTSTLYF